MKHLILFSILIILLQGCGINIKNVGIGVIDIESNHTLFLPSKEYREVIVNVDHSHNFFRTYQKLGEYFSVIREISFDGKKLSRNEIPFTIAGYLALETWSVSPDGKLILYFYPYANCLKKFDVSAYKDEIIFPAIATGNGGIRKIFWLSDKEILIVLSKDIGREKNEILVLNIKTLIKKTIVQPSYLYDGCYSLSPTKKYFTYRENNYERSTKGKINIVNIDSKKIIAQIDDPNTEIKKVCWDQKGIQLAYIKKNTIYSYTITNSKSETIKILPQDLIILDLIFFDVDKLACIVGKSTKEKGLKIFKEFHLVDLTGKEIWKNEKQFWGDIFSADNGKKVLCELGYVNLF